jgi:L-ascorbate metabolism protein UlaG (beta-lactamase superfamily)
MPNRRLLLVMFVPFLVVFALIFGAGSYAWNAFVWNFLSRTPYVKVTSKPHPDLWDKDRLTVCWIGHATVLLNFHGTTILTDPVLTERIAPIYLGGHVNLGIRRITELPLAYAELPPIDLVLLSHAHYDHWDTATLTYFGSSTAAVIPSGTRDLLPQRHFGNIIELPWKSRATIGGLTIEAFKTEHWGGRTFGDRTPRGYNGYVISDDRARVVFVGDSAFHERGFWPTQREIDWSARIGGGNINLCILPIGVSTYPYNHMSPEEAWHLREQIGAKWFLPIHWRTFIQCPPDREPMWEPIRRLKYAARGQNPAIVGEEPGSTFVLPEERSARTP